MKSNNNIINNYQNDFEISESNNSFKDSFVKNNNISVNVNPKVKIETYHNQIQKKTASNFRNDEDEIVGKRLNNPNISSMSTKNNMTSVRKTNSQSYISTSGNEKRKSKDFANKPNIVSDVKNKKPSMNSTKRFK